MSRRTSSPNACWGCPRTEPSGEARIAFLPESGGPGVGDQYGEASLRGKRSWVEGVLGGHPEWPEIFRFESQRVERTIFEGEPMVLFFRTREAWGGEALEGVFRVQEEDGRISRVRSYSFCPETMREVAEALDLPVRTGMYRAPTVEPGVFYGDE